MKKIKFLVLVIGLLSVFLAGCVPTAEDAVTVASPVIETPTELPEEAELPVVVLPADIGGCSQDSAEMYPVAGSLSELIKNATGSYPGVGNTCFSIFNSVHGNRTNWLYIKNGWALLNLPVEIFVPWEGDTFIVGDPASVAGVAVIDKDTIVVDGGILNHWQDGNLIKMVDWSSVSGGIYVHEVLFESDRLKMDANNLRFWTAWCDGNEYDNAHLQEALACGRGE